MGNLHKELENCKHPNSRKTRQLAKKAKRMNNRQKSRLGHAIKSNVIGEKLSWFSGKLEQRFAATSSNTTQPPSIVPLTPDEFIELIEEYLKRFDEELEQIALKQSISKNRSKQHAARETVIRFTLERERNEFNGGGLELLNLCDPKKIEALLNWDGNAINVQHFKLDLISRNFLKKLKEDQQKQNSNEQNNEEQIENKMSIDTPTIIVTSYCDDDL